MPAEKVYSLLAGSWEIVATVINKVSIDTITYHYNTGAYNLSY